MPLDGLTPSKIGLFSWSFAALLPDHFAGNLLNQR
jgi:hypothetical protein